MRTTGEQSNSAFKVGFGHHLMEKKTNLSGKFNRIIKISNIYSVYSDLDLEAHMENILKPNFKES